MTKHTIKSGQITDVSGQYAIGFSNGRISQNEVTLIKGNKVPPTPKPNQIYVLVDPTKHTK